MTASIESVVDSLLQGHVEAAVDGIDQVLNDPGEVNGLREFSDLIQESARQEQIQRESIKEVIAAYLSMSDDLETAITQDKSADAIGQEISQLQAQQQQALQATNAADQQCQALRDERDKMQARQQQLSHMKETVKEDTTQVLPKTRYNVSLYSCITGIKWDYDSKPEEIKGYVSTSKDVRPFTLDSRQHSKFFITNYLWDLVEAAADSK